MKNLPASAAQSVTLRVPDESQPTIEKLRKILDDLDFIEDTLKEMIDYTVQDDPAEFQLKNVDRIRTFIHKELHRRECDLLERFQRTESV